MINFPFKPSFLIDIDKTLTNSNRKITFRTKKAIQQLLKKDFNIGVCTGRTYAVVNKEILDLFGDKSVHVFSGGGELTNNKGECFFYRPIDSDLVKEIFFEVDKFDGAFFTSQGRTVFVNKHFYQPILKYGVKKSNLVIPASSKKNWAASLVSIRNVNDPLRNFLNSLKNVNIVKMLNYQGLEYYDITAKGVNKALGARQWANYHKIDISEVVAIGDGENDLEIFQAAGFGVAMGNASENLKAVADEIIENTDDDGLAKYLEEISSKY